MKFQILALPILLLLAACGGNTERFVLEAPATASARSSAPQTSPAEPVRSAGPLTLGGIGKYMDAQESDLRNRLRSSGALVMRPGDDLVIVLRNDQLFDGAQVSGSGNELLASIADVLRHYDHSSIQIQGFTDTVGAPDRNLTLSDGRARAVYNVLAGDGVTGARLSVQGYGETRLRFATGDNVNEPRNRRIEIRIIARPG